MTLLMPKTIYSKWKLLKLLRLTVRSNVKPKCGNNSSESLHMFLCSNGSLFRLSYFIGSVQVNGPMQRYLLRACWTVPSHVR